VLAAALLALASGVCLFGDDCMAAHAAPDLCPGMLAVTLLAVSIAPLLARGEATGFRLVAPHLVVRCTPDPPPRPVRAL